MVIGNMSALGAGYAPLPAFSPPSSPIPQRINHPLSDGSTLSPLDAFEMSLDALSPVHHVILEYLALITPTKALVLSRQCLEILSPVVYRHAIASPGLIYGISNPARAVWNHKLKMLNYIRALEIQDMSSMWMLGRLKYPSSETDNLCYDKNLFGGVTKVLITREVFNGFYYKTEDDIRTLVSFDKIWKDFKSQVPMAP
ncbi:hypothetical protein IAT38_002992 [Cryptococcus sp. DSM 104549]